MEIKQQQNPLKIHQQDPWEFVMNTQKSELGFELL